MISSQGERKEHRRHVIKLKSVRQCPIIIGAGLLKQLDRYFDFSGYSSLVLITDSNVKKLYGKSLLETLKATGKKASLLSFRPGEPTKALNTVERGYRFLLEKKTDRRGLICLLGGGVIGDVGGYIAASYLRGLDYIQLPTTLLAQVDSSIGGKVGVNFGGKKNMVGSFYQPQAVISDVSLLKTLPAAETQNGIAEAIKYGVAMDKGLFRTFEGKERRDCRADELQDIVTRCSRFKAGVIAADERERSGKRAILNFGHTIGHALEAVEQFQGRGHGEAVSIGIAAAARISRQMGKLDEGSLSRIEKLLLKFGLPIYCQGVKPEELMAAIRYDKKTTLGKTRWVLLNGIGRGVTGQLVEETLLKKVLKELCQ